MDSIIIGICIKIKSIITSTKQWIKGTKHLAFCFAHSICSVNLSFLFPLHKSNQSTVKNGYMMRKTVKLKFNDFYRVLVQFTKEVLFLIFNN